MGSQLVAVHASAIIPLRHVNTNSNGARYFIEATVSTTRFLWPLASRCLMTSTSQVTSAGFTRISSVCCGKGATVITGKTFSSSVTAQGLA